MIFSPVHGACRAAVSARPSGRVTPVASGGARFLVGVGRGRWYPPLTAGTPGPLLTSPDSQKAHAHERPAAQPLGLDPRPPARVRPAGRLRVEPLEDRLTPAGAGPETHLNVTTALDQTEPATASTRAATGNTFLHVTAWTHQASATDTDIHARLFDSGGLGPAQDIVVANTAQPESEPAVAMDAAGNWVVVWTVTRPGGGRDLFGAQFDAAGNRRHGGNFAVATLAASDYEPDVAAAPNGDFVVVFTRDRGPTNSDVVAKMYRDGRAVVRAITVAGSAVAEHRPSVARNDNGLFSVGYQVEQNGGDVHVRRYGAGGGLLQVVKLATTAVEESFPDVAIDDDNNTLVAWQQRTGASFDVEVQMARANGTLGPLRGVATTAADELFPSLALEMDGGKDFAVAYQVGADSTGAARGVVLKEMDYDNGTLLDTHDLGTNRAAPSLSVTLNEELIVGYVHLDAAVVTAGEAGTGVYGRRINLSA